MSVRLVFSLIVKFYLTKTENRRKKSLRQLSLYCFSKSTILAKNPWLFAKNADISKIKRALVIKDIFSKIKFGCVLTCQISRF